MCEVVPSCMFLFLVVSVFSSTSLSFCNWSLWFLEEGLFILVSTFLLVYQKVSSFFCNFARCEKYQLQLTMRSFIFSCIIGEPPTSWWRKNACLHLQEDIDGRSCLYQNIVVWLAEIVKGCCFDFWRLVACPKSRRMNCFVLFGYVVISLTL
jgi:hypothetical protein